LLGVDGGSDIKRSLLLGIYKRIAKEPLRPNDDHTLKIIAVDNSVTGLHKPVIARITCLVICLLCVIIVCLQCFDAVGWAAGRASGL